MDIAAARSRGANNISSVAAPNQPTGAPNPTDRSVAYDSASAHQLKCGAESRSSHSIDRHGRCTITLGVDRVSERDRREHQ